MEKVELIQASSQKEKRRIHKCLKKSMQSLNTV